MLRKTYSAKDSLSQPGTWERKRGREKRKEEEEEGKENILIIHIKMKRMYMLTYSGYFWVVDCRELCIYELILSLLRIFFYSDLV